MLSFHKPCNLDSKQQFIIFQLLVGVPSRHITDIDDSNASPKDNDDNNSLHCNDGRRRDG
jgi:hypothetical protein